MTILDPERQTERMWNAAAEPAPMKAILDGYAKSHAESLATTMEAADGIDGELIVEKTWQVGDYLVTVTNTRRTDL